MVNGQWGKVSLFRKERRSPERAYGQILFFELKARTCFWKRLVQAASLRLINHLLGGMAPRSLTIIRMKRRYQAM